MASIKLAYTQELEIIAPLRANQILQAAGCWWDRNSSTMHAHPWDLSRVSSALEKAGYEVHEDDGGMPSTLRQEARRVAIAQARATLHQFRSGRGAEGERTRATTAAHGR